MKTLRAQADELKARMQSTVDRAKAAERDLTAAEAEEIETLADQHRDLTARSKKAADAAAMVADLAHPQKAATATRSGSSHWAKAVAGRMAETASGYGVKALLSGEVSTPPTVEVVDLPAVPTSLLDLIPREGLASNTFSYLRQTVRTDNAAVVADGALKPTSIYTFEEVEDRARVIAHLSEPFPLRYLADHSSVLQVLDAEMRQGVLDALSAQVVAGDGVGENLTGVLNATGVTNVAFDTDRLTTVRKARTALENKGENPTAWVLNPADVETFELMREDGATGGFLMGTSSYDTVFGPGVSRVSSLAVPVGTAILADWSKIRLRVREDVGSLAATQAGDLFDKNQVKLRAEGRWGLQYLRPQSAAVVTLTAAV